MPRVTTADADQPPPITSLAALARAEGSCTRCPLYKDATQAVPGNGKASARIMLVGEQPGNDEDLAGEPFIGPAGRMLDKALADAGITRADTFVTNAVKHFKFELRGKRRLHKKPSAYEIERCNWWLDLEKRIVGPELIIALGVTAARALTGKPVTIARVRRTVMSSDGLRLVVTVHPSSLLRLPDEVSRKREYQRFVSDLQFCNALVAHGIPTQKT